MKNPYDVIKSRLITEKATVLERLHTAESNKSLSRCKTPKFVFLVDRQANKRDIAEAIEAIHKEQKVTVVKVNTLNVKGKVKRRGRGKARPGATSAFKKAIVTLSQGDSIDNI